MCRSDDLRLGTIVPEKAEGTRVEVRTVPADPYVAGFDPATPTLIKIDVEGYEVQVLQGLRSLLAWPDVMLVIEIADAKLRRAGHSRDELHALLASFGLVAHTIHVRSSRWRKDLELRPLPGPLAIEEYDALFARPGSAVYRNQSGAGVGPDFRAEFGEVTDVERPPRCLAMVTPAWPPGAAPNGIVTYTSHLAPAFRQRGTRTVLLAWDVPKGVRPEREDRGRR